jgi:phage-related protein
MGVITFNGISSQERGIQVERLPGYETPERDYEVIHVPGKNGDLVIDMGSYKNVSRSYQIAKGSLNGDFSSIANNISEWLHSASGYARLEDSYEPAYYRLAVYMESSSIENLWGNAGRVTINFDCKPQRFLKSGDNPVTVGSGGNLNNPTGFDSLPIITVRGSGNGVLTIGDYIVNISSITSSITINSEIQDAYNGTTNRNSTISLSNGFPKLTAGGNRIAFSGGITSVEVIPKWWTL